MINFVGKTLVMVAVGMSFVFLAFALAIYTNQIDWGWKEPRKKLDYRIPSEIDKVSAAVKIATETRFKAEANLKVVQANLETARQNLAQNYLLYKNELARLETAPNDIEVKNLVRVGGSYKINPSTGSPVLGDKVDPNLQDAEGNPLTINKSFNTYDAEFRNLQKEIGELAKKKQKVAIALAEKTKYLHGIPDPADPMKKLKPGLYELRDEEIDLQRVLRDEIKQIRPLWVRVLANSDLLLQRRRRLETRVRELDAILSLGRN